MYFFQFSIVESREKFKSLEEYIYMQKININWLFKEEENSTDNHKGKVLKTYKIIYLTNIYENFESNKK